MAAPRRLYIARHGQTDWNLAGRWQGSTDVPLNAAGRSQARALAERLRAEGLTAVASSDLARARETAHIVADALGLPVEMHAGLREQCYGRFEGLTRAECQVVHPDAWARYVADSRDLPPDAEPHAAVAARVALAFRELSERLPAPALVVLHGGVMRTLLRERLGDIPSPASPRWAGGGIANCAVFRLSVSAGRVLEAERLEEVPAPPA